MARLEKLAEKMERAWERRIGTDYLGWRNDRVYNDQELIQSGERDFALLIEGVCLHSASKMKALDLGCGVGRLMLPASKVFGSVVGVDISREAIRKAKTILSGLTNAELRIGNGIDLSSFDSDSFEFVYSFGVLSNMPVLSACNYFLEVSRVLKEGGEFRTLLFIGQGEPTVQDDTAAYRVFNFKRLAEGLTAAGFEAIRTYSYQAGSGEKPTDSLEPRVIISRKKNQPSSVSPEEIEQLILGGTELQADPAWPGSSTECLIAVKRASELSQRGDNLQALRVLRLARQQYRGELPAVDQAIKRLEALKKGA